MISFRILPPLSPLGPLSLREYVCLHSPCLDVECFQFILLDSELSWVYDTRNGAERLLAAGAWVERCMRWSDRGAVRHRKVMSYYIDTFFLRCTEEDAYTRCWSLL